jgi:hypothetical protein
MFDALSCFYRPRVAADDAKHSRLSSRSLICTPPRQNGNIANIVRRQFCGDDLLRGGIKAETQLPPPSARPQTLLLREPFTLAIHRQSGTIDQKMLRLIAPGQDWREWRNRP